MSAAEERLGRTDTDWMVMARDPIDLQPLSGDARWVPARLDPGVQLWTDDYSNIVTLLGETIRRPTASTVELQSV